ncbi:FxDxF family PEP-CTERM protein [Lichenihabitans sp. Uapishka_5]|uniref:FxDxF family PEP-CTERM protein n=1 Tax=Lichenihabitans sp. Uapishka_5 TaxID=3037302 RepID=UPI0029E7F07D|nr:FxDxF family PEP-CTERM protein [Lichenihabitans sp. Uapishka_5]MDX7951673.1 FxDxF family PEP-CTERM protein [Lichenihabitans sp. Uapishka_5]
MTSLLRIGLLAGAVIFPAIAPAHASTISFGVVTGTPANDSRSWMNTVKGTFTDYATFSTVSTASFSASITNSYSSAAQYISDFTLALYSGSIGSGTLVTSFTSTDPNAPPETQGTKLKAFLQPANNYYLQVSGTTSDTPSYGGSLAVSSVPLPSSAPLFAAGLFGLGVLGYRAKRRKVLVQA